MEDKQQNATVSPSLIYQGNFNDPLPETFNRICMHLEYDTRDKVMPCCSGDAKIGDLFIQASQMYKSSRDDGENDDNLLL